MRLAKGLQLLKHANFFPLFYINFHLPKHSTSALHYISTMIEWTKCIVMKVKTRTIHFSECLMWLATRIFTQHDLRNLPFLVKAKRTGWMWEKSLSKGNLWGVESVFCSSTPSRVHFMAVSSITWTQMFSMYEAYKKNSSITIEKPFSLLLS